MELTPEQNSYKTELQTLIDKSQDQFEKQLSWISSGAIGVTMIVIEKIFKDLSKTNYVLLLGFGWILLAITLLINLISHLIAFHYHCETLSELNQGNDDYFIKGTRRRSRIEKTNWWSVGLLFIGLVCIILYITINLNHGKAN